MTCDYRSITFDALYGMEEHEKGKVSRADMRQVREIVYPVVWGTEVLLYLQKRRNP